MEFAERLRAHPSGCWRRLCRSAPFPEDWHSQTRQFGKEGFLRLSVNLLDARFADPDKSAREATDIGALQLWLLRLHLDFLLRRFRGRFLCGFFDGFLGDGLRAGGFFWLFRGHANRASHLHAETARGSSGSETVRTWAGRP